MAAATLDALLADARLYADERPGGTDAYVADSATGAEGYRLLVHALRRLQSDLVDAGGGDYFATSASVSVVSGTASYALPSDHLQTVQVRIQWGTSDFEDVPPWQRPSRSLLDRSGSWGRNSPKGYALIGGNLVFAPTPTVACTVVHDYVPEFTVASVAGATSVDLKVPGWQEWAALDVAATMREMQDLESRHILARRDDVYEKIMRRVTDRVLEPMRLLDVEAIAQANAWPYGEL